MKFNRGDLVRIVAVDASSHPHAGKVGLVTEHCLCFCSALSPLPFYRIDGLQACCREDTLRLIGGERTDLDVKETRDEPVAA
jgi:hypothetical protein